MRRQLRAYPLAFFLLGVTLLYNVVEGLLAITSGLQADSIVLITFGMDSYLEVLAAAAVIWRLSYLDDEAGERAEKRALRLIGVTFLVLAVAVVFQAALAFASTDGASESPLGVALLAASLTIMPILAIAKLRTAARANLPALAAEAKETIACSYLSLTALAGLAVTWLAGAWWLDPLAALLMVPWLGKEAWAGIRGDACFDGTKLCWCRECWYGLRGCTSTA
ncbi:MAG: cation transporter [Dehalococcoidia bacterium]